MKQIGSFCPCLLILMLTTTSVQSREIVTFSIYDEFGDIMSNNSGQLTLNRSMQSLPIDDEDLDSVDFENFRYRKNTYESAYMQGKEALTTYNKKHYQKKVWKFRPLEKDKKDIIKIEEPPVTNLLQPAQQPVNGTSSVITSGNYPAWGYSNWLYPGFYGPGAMTPGMYSPGMMSPGLYSPGLMMPGMTFPIMPFRK